MTLQSLMNAGQRVLLVGPPGCAKTERIKTVAKEAGREIVIMRASLSERVDFGGALVPDMNAGITKALPLELLHNLRTTTVPTLLFLDDLGQAPIDVQAALMRLFDDDALSDQVLIWGATNRPGDVAGVTRLCEPLRSRFHLAFAIATQGSDVESPDGAVTLGTWGEEVDGWCQWAMNVAGAPPEVVAWQRSTSGRTLYQWKPHADPGVRMPDYRSWETVIKLWNAGIRDLSSVAAAIGKPTAAEFLAFARLADQLPTPDQVWADPKGSMVPKDPAALYLVVSMLAASAHEDHAAALVTYLGRLPRVYSALLARDAFRRIGPKLARTKEWTKWFLANEELFSVGVAA